MSESEKDISALLKKYNDAKEAGKNAYFDADEFGDLAEYYDSSDDLDTARDIIDEGLLIHPDSTSLLVKRAKLAVYDGDYEEALSLLKTSSEYDFDLYLLRIECYLQLEQYQQAYKLSEELLEKEDQESLDNVFAELGYLHVEADCHKEAILYFEESLKYNAENIEALSDLAYSYEMLDDFDAAIKTTNRILDIEPYTYEAWINLGKLYSLSEEYEKAVDAFDFALTINDSDSSVLKLKAHCLSLSGRVKEAIGIFEEMLQSKTADTFLYFLLAECHQTLEMYDEALSYLEKYQQLEGDTEDLLSKEAYLHMQRGDFRKASSIAENGALLYPDSSEFDIIAGEIAFRQERYPIAEKYLLNVYKQNKEDFHLTDLLAMINIKQENYPEAAYYTEELLRLDSNNLGVKQRLALLYFEMDNKERFNEILDQFSDDELISLFQLIYTPESNDYFNRDMLISYLNKARETRTLFKNLKY